MLSLQPDFGFRWRVSQAVPGPNTYRGSDASARLPPASERMVVSANTFLDGSAVLPSPPKTGASISINRLQRTGNLIR